MTTREFRKTALSFPEVSEKSHFAHPDFRLSGKIFATLVYPRKGWGVVMLTPKLQKDFVESDPDVFIPVTGKWGIQGATKVYLRLAKKSDVRKALVAAWWNKGSKRLKRRVDLQ
ncbi:MAG: MmcQ/YjbR family DNA-binding protein [Ignavibacteriales bacterium]|nr:MmcQ/YjbR family DNA-binding protein [Ignavibacteriales bacterium]